MQTAAEYLAQLEKVKRESGGMRPPTLDQYGIYVKLVLREIDRKKRKA